MRVTLLLINLLVSVESQAAFESDSDSIKRARLNVSSLERAETHLRESGMIGTITDEEISINPAKIEGHRVRLVQ
jgi:hypothetical protein